MTTLTVTRKADRLEMARLLTVELETAGAKVERDSDLEQMMPRAIVLQVSTEWSLSVTVDFDGDSPHPEKDTFVLSWYFADRSTSARLAEAFCPGNINPCHRHKATDVAYGFDNLRGILLQRIALAQSGEAFEVSQ